VRTITLGPCDFPNTNCHPPLTAGRGSVPGTGLPGAGHHKKGPVSHRALALPAGVIALQALSNSFLSLVSGKPD
jgi:hypothetical protein